MADSLEELLGGEAIEAAAAFNQQAPTTLRVNTLRARVDRVQHALPGAVKTGCSPWALELPARVNIHEQPGFKEGWYEIQEEASQLASLISNVTPGMTVVDVGAGAGGKTLALAAMLNGSGTLIAVEISDQRLEELQERAERARARGIISCRVHAAEETAWTATSRPRKLLGDLTNRADCVFVDAPCTGAGAIRRNPDAKWNNYDATAMSGLQLRMLLQAAELVAPSGLLVYVTCAFERWQNEDVVERFLQTPFGGQFEITPVLPLLEAAAGRAAGRCGVKCELHQDLVTGPYLRTWPHRHRLDAFFGACLRRRPLSSKQ
jgi:16S rRNA (cytosine967-C5)-methyltransferase